MCKNSLFIPQSMKSKHSFLFYFKIAKELSEFRNYLNNHLLSIYKYEALPENLSGVLGFGTKIILKTLFLCSSCNIAPVVSTVKR